MKFRKRPVVVEAIRLEKGMVIEPWLDAAIRDGVVILRGLGLYTRDKVYAVIETLEGTMRADDGDWIICGVKGEIYPCKPDIFDKTYDPA